MKSACDNGVVLVGLLLDLSSDHDDVNRSLLLDMLDSLVIVS